MSGLEKNSISLAERNDALSRVIELNGKPSLIFLSAFSLAQKIPEKKYFYNTLLDLKVGQNLEISKLINNLIKYGYKRTHMVENLGEFSVRGSLIDIFSAGQELPIRVDFYEDFIDGIRVFDPVTQRTVGRQNNLIIRAIDYQNINNISEGSITDLIGNSSCFVQINPKSSGHLVNQYKQRYTQKGIDDFLFDWKEINISLKKFKNKIYFENLKVENKLPTNYIEIKKMDLPKINISPTNPIKSSVESIKELSKKFLLSVSSTTNERLKKEIEGNKNVLFNNQNLNYSFAIKIFDHNFLFLGDKELFGYNFRSRKSVNRSQSLKNEKIFEINSFVVHEDHGVAKFKGITKLINHFDKEYLELEFAENDKLFVPAEQISKIDIYKGGENNLPTLHRLHGKEWERQNLKFLIG